MKQKPVDKKLLLKEYGDLKLSKEAQVVHKSKPTKKRKKVKG